MKIKLFLFSLFLALAPIGVFAQPHVGGSVKGKLLRATGKPLPYTELELVPVEAKKIVVDPRLIGISDTTGNFSFSNLPEGKYTLSINLGENPSDTSPYATFFYPNATERGEAQIFEIKSDSKFTGIIFRLPAPLTQKKIAGKVVFTDGKPVANAWLAVRDLANDRDIFRSFGGVKTDKNGNFSTLGFVGRRYQIAGILLQNPPDLYSQEPNQIIAAGETPVFILEQATPDIRLVLKTQEDYKWVREKYVARIDFEKCGLYEN